MEQCPLGIWSASCPALLMIGHPVAAATVHKLAVASAVVASSLSALATDRNAAPQQLPLAPAIAAPAMQLRKRLRSAAGTDTLLARLLTLPVLQLTWTKPRGAGRSGPASPPTTATVTAPPPVDAGCASGHSECLNAAVPRLQGASSAAAVNMKLRPWALPEEVSFSR
jgi:hypothetical protein